MMNELMRVKEAAKRLGVSSKTIRNMIDRGKFPGARKINPDLKNSPYRIPISEVEALQLETETK